MKLELKHLAPYLPYGLKGMYFEEKNNTRIEIVEGLQIFGNCIEVITDFDNMVIDSFKPILRPLSDLTKEIEVNGENLVPIEVIKKEMLIDFSFYNSDGIMSLKTPTKVLLIAVWTELADECPLLIYNKMLEWHFDVFGLIEKGLAIDINTLNNV